jgi:multiple sugar transport system substrate-binding protein
VPSARRARASAPGRARRLVPAWLRASCLLGLAACAADGPARVTLRVSNWADWSEQRLEDAYVHTFSRAHPGVRVQMEAVTNGPEYRDRVLASIAAGAPPDVVQLDNIDIPAFVDAGVLQDLAPYLERVGLRRSAFEPRVLAIFRRGAALYAIPKDFTPMLIAYNKDLFDRAGVPYPDGDWTWESFVAAARRLTRDTDGDGRVDQWGFWLDRRDFMWIPSIWALGGDVLCPDGARASGCLDSPTSIWAFRAFTGLATRDSVTPRFYGLRRTMGDQLRQFYSGHLAMIPAGHFWLPQLRPYVARGRLRIGFAPFPHRAGFPPATVLYASGFAVPRNVRHKRLSVELAAFMVDSLAQVTRAAGALAIPALTAIARQVADADTTGWEAAFDAAVSSGRMPWGARVAKWREVEDVLPDIMDRVILNHEDVALVLRDVARKVDRVLGWHGSAGAGSPAPGRAARSP